MLRIVIPAEESWDERNEKFVIARKEQVLQLEHSLVSLSKWESKWCKAFLSKKEKTYEETIDYIKCMTITQNVDPEIYNHINRDIVAQVEQYINAPMTATTFREEPGGKSKSNREIITSEIIYYWMVTLGIPLECQKWHLNRLLTLIRVCDIKNSPPKKRSKKEMLSSRASLNAARKKKMGTRG